MKLMEAASIHSLGLDSFHATGILTGVETARYCTSDNGPELIAQAIQDWLRPINVETLYIEPGSPWQNGYAESFHSRFRNEFLAVEVFENVAAARRLTDIWKDDYSQVRPHGGLDYQTPGAFAAACVASAPATPTLQQHTRPTATSTLIQSQPS